MFNVESTTTEEFKKACATLVEIITHGSMKVSFIGDTAMCNYDNRTGKPQNMILPNIEVGASNELKGIMRGYLDHEVGHLLFTNFPSIKKTLATLKGKEYQYVYSLFNIVEDARIEQKMKEKYDGSKINIDCTETEMFLNRAMNVVDEESFPCEKIINGLIVKCRDIRGDTLAKSIVENNKVFYTPCEEFLAKYPKVKDSIRNAKNSEEVLETARLIYQSLLDDQGEDQMPNTEGSSSETVVVVEKSDSLEGGQSSGQSVSIKEDKENESSQDGEKDNKEDKKDEKSDDGEKSENSNSSENEGASGGGDSEKKAKTIQSEDEVSIPENIFGKLLQKLIEKEYKNEFLQEDLKELINLPPLTRDFDRFEKLAETEDFKDIRPSLTEARKKTFLMGINQNTTMLEKQFERYLNSQSHSMWEYGQTKGKLYGAGLVKLRTGNEKIFRKKIVNKTKDVAVSLVVDCSGSMEGEKFHNAMRSAYIFSKALARVGITHEVVGFTTRQLPYRWENTKATADAARSWNAWRDGCSHGVLYGRYESLYLPIFKDFTDRFDGKILETMANANCNGINGLENNDDADSLLMIAKHLREQPQSRKIMFVFSDGYPYYANFAGRQLGTEELKQALATIEKWGVEVFGIGIRSYSVSDFYKNYAVVNDLDELSTTLLAKLKQFLTKK